MLMNKKTSSRHSDAPVKGTPRNGSQATPKLQANSCGVPLNMPLDFPCFGYMPMMPPFGPVTMPYKPSYANGFGGQLSEGPGPIPMLPWHGSRPGTFSPQYLESLLGKPTLSLQQQLFNCASLDANSNPIMLKPQKLAIEGELVKSLSLSDDNTLRQSSSLISLLTNMSDKDYHNYIEEKRESRQGTCTAEEQHNLAFEECGDGKKLPAKDGEEPQRKVQSYSPPGSVMGQWDHSAMTAPPLKGSADEDKTLKSGQAVDQMLLKQIATNQNLNALWTPPNMFSPLSMPLFSEMLAPLPVDCSNFNSFWMPAKEPAEIPSSASHRRQKNTNITVISVPKPKEMAPESRKRSFDAIDSSLDSAVPTLKNVKVRSNALIDKVKPEGSNGSCPEPAVDHACNSSKEVEAAQSNSTGSNLADPHSGDKQLASEKALPHNQAQGKKRRIRKKRVSLKPEDEECLNDGDSAKEASKNMGRVPLPYPGSLMPGSHPFNSHMMPMPYPMYMASPPPFFPMPMTGIMPPPYPPQMFFNPLLQPGQVPFTGNLAFKPNNGDLNHQSPGSKSSAKQSSALETPKCLNPSKRTPSLLDIANSATAALRRDSKLYGKN